MEIKEKMQNAINKQINKELYSAYLYLSMSAYFESINLRGFAHWMRKQAKEEEGHAMRLYRYLIERGGRVKLSEIEEPPAEWKSASNVFEETYKHEQKITEMIDELIKMSVAEKDHATEVFLHWFVTEQVEEEASANEILQKLKMIKEEGNGLFIIDRELANRK